MTTQLYALTKGKQYVQITQGVENLVTMQDVHIKDLYTLEQLKDVLKAIKQEHLLSDGAMRLEPYSAYKVLKMHNVGTSVEPSYTPQGVYYDWNAYYNIQGIKQ